MKFNTTFYAYIVLVLSLTLCCSCARFKSHSSSVVDIVNSVMNRGVSYLNMNSDILKDVEKLANLKQIFNFDIDFSKNYFGDFYVSQEHFRSAINRNLTNLNSEEMTKNTKVTLKGNFKVAVGSSPYHKGNSHILRKVKKSHVFSDTIGALFLIMNHNKNFPNLHSGVLNEAYKTFYQSPNMKSPNHTIADLNNDKETIKAAIKFFNEFGTHYISAADFGYRSGFYQEYKSNATVAKDSKGNSPQPDLIETNQDNKPSNSNPNVTDINLFTVGQCKLQNSFIRPETCDRLNPKAVRLDISPIETLFNPLMQVKRDFAALNEPLTRDKMKTIHSNMAHLNQEIQLALDPNLYVITKLESFKLKLSDTSKDCLKVKPSTLNKIYSNFKQTRNELYYKEDVFIRNKHLPVTSFKNYGKMRSKYQIVSNGDEGMFWCLTRSHNITPEELKAGKILNKEEKMFLIDVKIVVDHDAPAFKEAGFTCQEAWDFVDKKSKNENRWHFCTKWTENFIEGNIITDLKFFQFHPKMGKCVDKTLNTYIDGKYYDCDCDMNFSSISDEKNKGDTFLCKSRKTRPFSKPVSPNQPKVTSASN